MRVVAASAGALAILAAAACTGGGGASGANGGGQGGGGGCPVGVQATFDLTIKAADGPVPADTRLVVSWSAGEEPAFELDDPGTWKTLDDGVNVVCDVDHAKPPPTDLSALVCHLWTSGATQIDVTAAGYANLEKTLTPKVRDECGGPVPSDVDVTLEPEPDDAGP